ncbi:Ig-like domain-containing protein [Methanobacterium sp.]|uniref:Ig-like domain-containing protein n=1 Tax=Methanobacterium sp. TaxID=2164 RepID=UPI003C72F15B
MLSAVSTVSAADSSTIYVNDSSGNDDWDGQYAEWISGLSGPKKSIKNATGTVIEGGTVHIADGNYRGITNTNIIITKNMTIIGQSKKNTVINGTDSSWIFNIQNDKNVTIQNLTLANGTATNYGGAIANSGTLTIDNCAFTGNKAGTGGGAVYSLNTLPVTINNSTFINNAAPNGGGAIYKGNAGILIINNCTFINNTATSNAGGAIYSAGTLAIDKCIFSGNKAANGGAIISFGTWNVDDCTFINNTAGNGGAIYNSASIATINRCIFINNSATHGGAVTNYNTLTINSSTFTDNRASAYGGAIYNTWGGTTTVNFSKIVGNIAGDIQEDIYNSSGSVNAELNWWGSNNGPSGRVSGLTISKWLVLTIIATPITINNSEISTIRANLLYDNGILGDPTNPGLYYHDPAEGHVPDGIPVLFTTNLGNIGNEATKYTLNGEAAAALTEYKVGGTATVTASVDDQPASTSVTIIDIVPPVVNSIDPVNKARIKIVNKSIKITFSEPIHAGSAYNSISITGPSGSISITKSISGNVLTLIPASNYVNGNYVILIPVNAISDSSSNGLAAAFYSNFTIDAIKPTSWANIKTGSYNVSKSITLTMSEPGIIYYTKNGTTPTTASTKYSGPIAITSTTTLKFFAVDLAGNPSSVYTEKYIIDRTAPKIISTSPRSGATGISRTGIIAIKLNENIKAGINWSKIAVKNRYGKAVSINKRISGNMLYIKTTYKRSSYSYYTVYVPKAALKDYAGNNFAGYSFRFKTGRY